MTIEPISLRRWRSTASWRLQKTAPVAIVTAIGTAIGLGLTRRPILLAAVALLLIGISTALSPRGSILVAIPALMLPSLPVGPSVPIDYTVIGALAVCWLMGLLLGRWPLRRRVHAPIALLSIWLVVVWNLHHAHGHLVSVASDFHTLLLGLLLCAVAASVRPDPWRVLQATAVSGTGVVIAVVFSGGSNVANQRLSIMGLNSNYLGLLLATSLCASTALALSDRGFRSRAFFLCCAILQAVALFQTRSRGSYVAAAVGVLVVALVGRTRRVQLTIITGVALVALIAPSAPSTISAAALKGRTAQELNSDTNLRLDVQAVAWQTALRHPVTGIGYGSFPDIAAVDPRLGIFINTHNDYLRLSAEAGLPALALLLALLGVMVLLDVRRELDRALLAVLGAYFSGLMFANTLSNLKVTGAAWVLLGTSWALVLQRDRDQLRSAARGLARLRSDRHSSARGTNADSGVLVARRNQIT